MTDREVWSTMERQALRERDERVIAGRATPEDGMTDVVALLGALRSPAHDDECAGSDVLFEQFAVLVRGSSPSEAHATSNSARRTLLPLLTGKVVAIGAITVFSAGAAAAATGVLPASIQSTVDDALSRVGIDLDGSNDVVSAVPTTSSAGDEVGDTSGAAATPSIIEPATSPVGRDQLCRDRAEGDPLFDSAAQARLDEAASIAQVTVDELCATITGGSVTVTTVAPMVEPAATTRPATNGSSPSDTAPGRPDDPGRPDSPGNSGSTPADTAPGRPDDPGRPASPGKSGDAGPPVDDGTPGNGNGAP